MIGISGVDGASRVLGGRARTNTDGHGLTRTDTKILGVGVVENGVVFWVCWGRMVGKGFGFWTGDGHGQVRKIR
ncbi:MAG: hypothetical protein DRP66_03230 [Planctomycetota bacterium]|nr:MAG: hypothetical protein DRP66_03230 [Planctomycetota bacterium]